MIYTMQKSDTFESIINDNTDKIIIVDFYADWCGPCKMMNSVFNRFENDEEINDKIKIIKVNVDIFQDIAELYNVRWIPAFLIIKNKGVVNQLTWFKKTQDLKKIIQETINN